MKVYLKAIVLSFSLPLLILFACKTEDATEEDAYYSTSDYLEEVLIIETSRDDKPSINVWEDSIDGFQVKGSYQGIEYYYKQSSFPEDTVQMKIDALNLWMETHL